MGADRTAGPRVLGERSGGVLEFDRVREEIADWADTEPGRRRIRGLTPSDDRRWAEERHATVSELRAWRTVTGGMALTAAADLEPIWTAAAVEGTVLEPGDLMAVQRTATTAGTLADRLDDEEEWPRLAAIGERLPDLGRLVGQIEEVLDPDGQIRDDASPELARIRRRRRKLRARLRERMESMVHESGFRDALQDELVTQRGGRYVIPVKAEHRGAVEGVVHDTSSSGQTLYVEPLEVLEEQNELAALDRAEEEEVRRLLEELTAHVRAATPALRSAQEVLAEFDAVQAVARYADDLECVVPRFVERGLRVRGARHPLMVPRRQTSEVDVGPETGDDAAAGVATVREFVPIDLGIDPDTRILVITGPNTGGKTVVLKTVGLIVAMAQSGVPVPADDAAVGCAPRIYADIGDEQSIISNLSTFSSHLNKIISFLDDCPDGSLVLLDELGTGTDPEEGSALGIALLERFQALGALVLTSTHHDALKAFAHAHDGAENAAMEFDSETLEPTYRLLEGRPGRSNALEIASRLGLERDLVSRARTLMHADSVELDGLIRRLEEQSAELADRRRQVDERRDRLETARSAHGEARERFEEARDELKRRGREAIEEAVGELRKAGDRLIDELEEELGDLASQRTLADRRAGWASRAGEAEAEAVRRMEGAIAEVGDSVEEGVGGEDVEAGLAEEEVDEPSHGEERERFEEEADVERPLSRGDRVRVSPLGVVGSVAADWRPERDERDHVEVDVRGKRLIVGRDQVHGLAGETEGREGAGGRGGTSYRRKHDVSRELVLVGCTVEEALARADKYLDDAALAELPSVRLVHGFGEGTLRRALHEWLDGRPHVESYRLAEPEEGGGGATVVELRQ